MLDVSVDLDTAYPPESEPMGPASLVHQIFVDSLRPRVFDPTQLNAAVGDVILFTPANIRDQVVHVPPGLPCQADTIISSVNFSRLLYPYLVTTRQPQRFSCPSLPRNCSLEKRDTVVFNLNPPMNTPREGSSGISYMGTATASKAPLSGPFRTNSSGASLGWGHIHSTMPTATRAPLVSPLSFSGRATTALALTNPVLIIFTIFLTANIFI